MSSKLNAQIIQDEVQRFWNAFTSKDTQALSEFYAPESTVFGSISTRLEPGRLAATRRQREYFHTKAVLKARTSMVEVLMLGDAAGVAAYNFEFEATDVATGLGHAGTEKIAQGRATQVFGFDADGHLRILHEHLSIASKG
jgi:ketosteroid isomerase-like protein